MTRKNDGFSIIETIIAVSIILILAVAISEAFSKFRDSQVLNGSSQEVAALINKARSRTLASEKSLQYGVHFETNKAILFEGEVFNPSSPTNQELIISSYAEISSVSLNGGGPDLIFQKLTGKTNQYGIIMLRAKKDIVKIRKITVGATGILAIQQ